jgi:hypothetical protein
MTRSTGILSAFSQEAKLFSICCATGQFLLDFLKVTITAIVCIATLTTVAPPHMRHTPQPCRSIWLPLLGKVGIGQLCISITNAILLYCCENTIFWYKLKVLRHSHVYNCSMHSVIITMHRKHMTETLCTL